MAMEKLALKGVMWGADNVPDHWFEKLPFGYFKPEEDKKNSNSQENSKKDRRNSADMSRSEPDEYDDADHGYRSDGQNRSSRRGKNSSAQDSDRNDTNDRSSRRGSRKSQGPGRKDSVNADGGDYAQGRRGSRAGSYDVARGDAPYPVSQAYDQRRPSGYTPAQFVPATAAVATAGANGTSGSNPFTGVGNTAYVPYANIYGNSSQQSPTPSFQTMRSPTANSPSSNAMNNGIPVAPRPHMQNPYAQDAPAGSQPAYHVPGGRSEARAYVDNVMDQYDGKYDAYSTNATRDYSRSRRDDSASRSSQDSYDDQGRARRQHRDNTRSKSEGNRAQGKSRASKYFDSSQRGLGYGAVGALAGGLIGTEMGKGIGPPITGAIIGALGGNAYQARERRRDERRDSEYTRDGVYERGTAKHKAASGYISD